MRLSAIRTVRIPVVVASCLCGALLSAACGESDPAATGGGLAGTTGKGGTIGVGTGGASSGGKGGTVGSGKGGSTGGTIDVGTGGSSGSSSGTSGSGGLTDGEACVSVSRDSSKTQVALLFMVDISGSMNCPIPELSPPCEVDPNMKYPTTRWSQMKPALEDFFNNTQDMLAGISFFSKGGSCNVQDYERPDAEIAMLPGSKSALDQAVEQQTPGGQTPTLPSLQGALNHADAWASAHADQNVVVVYATDGYPKGCDSSNTIDNAAAAADKAYKGKNTIRTYVIGVGPNLTDLNKIAASGGTGVAFQLDTSQQDLTAQLKAKFNEIRSAVTVDCEYSVPMPPAGQTLDPNKVNVNYTSGTLAPVSIPFDDTGSCQEGWKYADATQQQIVLCGSTCDMVKADPDASIQVAFGCTTIKIGDPR